MFGGPVADDVRIMLANGQKIYLVDALLDSETPWLDSGAPNLEFQAGIARFSDPLISGLNADDFEHVDMAEIAGATESDVLSALL
jgi:hypothetical protein